MEYKYCFKCGNKLPMNARFCTKCGSKQPSKSENITVPDKGNEPDTEGNQLEQSQSTVTRQQLHQETQPKTNLDSHSEQFQNEDNGHSYTVNAYNESGHPNLANSFNIWLKNWNQFDVCMGRADYWWGILAIVIIGLLVGIISAFLISIADFIGSPALLILFYFIFMVVETILGFAYWPGTIERLHDTGKSGWYSCVCFIPIVGVYLVAYLCCQPTDWNSKQWKRP